MFLLLGLNMRVFKNRIALMLCLCIIVTLLTPMGHVYAKEESSILTEVKDMDGLVTWEEMNDTDILDENTEEQDTEAKDKREGNVQDENIVVSTEVANIEDKNNEDESNEDENIEEGNLKEVDNSLEQGKVEKIREEGNHLESTITKTFNADTLQVGSYSSSFTGGDGFTINISNSKVEVDANSKTADDGSKYSQRLKLGGVGNRTNRSISFSLESSASIKVYAMSSSSSADRSLTLYNAEDMPVGSVSAYGNSLALSTITVSQAGYYYFASPDSGVNVYGIVITITGDVDEERNEWEDVNPPNLLSGEQSGNKIILVCNLETGINGADKAIAYMMDENGDEIESKLVGSSPDNNKTIEFEPKKSATYSFKVVAEREEETSKKESNALIVSYVLPLQAPILKGVTNLGNGEVLVEWNSVLEASNYSIKYKVVSEENYQDGPMVTESQGVIGGLTAGATYSILVTANRGEEKMVSEAIEITVSSDKERPWYFTAFGQGVDKVNNYYIGNANEGSVTIASENGKGKLVPASTDGLAFYYTTIDPDKENFLLSARVTVDAWTLSNGQDGFGVMAADAVGVHGDSSVFWNNSYMNSVTKVEYQYNRTLGKVSDIGDKISMKLGIGAQEKKGVTASNILDGTISSNIGELFFSSMHTLESSCGPNGAGTYNIVGNYLNSEAPIGTVSKEDLQTTFKLTIQRDNTGYHLRYTNKDGITTSKLFYDLDRNALTQIDKDAIYIGFFASRNAKITVTDIELTTSDPLTDPPSQGREITYITPDYKVISTAKTGNKLHKLVAIANADGKIMIHNEVGTLIYENDKVRANTYINVDTILGPKDNIYKVTFTPDSDYKPSEYERLSSYETVNFIHRVHHMKFDRTYIYVSPNGREAGDGTKNNPLDLYTAVSYAVPGQMIILEEGNYSLTRQVIIERGISGSSEQPIYLIANPSSKSRPVLDFNKVGAGVVLAGDYWYLKGFDITNTQDMQKGIVVAGDYNVLDQVNTYHNGNTGIQISRFLSTDAYEDWPSNNLILNCTSYGNADRGYEDADGFAAKLTIGAGNVFDGCIAYNNADDGWDLFAKIETGPIGKVVITNSVAYGNGYLPDGTKAGNGNGFKLGGSSIPGNHELINSIAFDNKAKGIDSNSGPDIIISNSTTFNNESYNVALYTNDVLYTNYIANGILSYRTKHLSIGENIKPKGSQEESRIYGSSNYYWNQSTNSSKNTEEIRVEINWFVHLDTTIPITRNEDGTIQMNGLLELTDKAPNNTGARMTGTSSKNFEIKENDNPSITPTPTITPEPTGSPTPTITPEPTVTPTPPQIPEAIMTPIPEETLEEIRINDMLLKEKDVLTLYVGGTQNTSNMDINLPESINDNHYITISFKSSDTSVVSVTKSGLLKAKKEGTATITTRFTIVDRVYNHITEVTVKKASISFVNPVSSLNIGDKISYKIKLVGFEPESIQWKTSKKQIAVVGRNKGKLQAMVTGKSEGIDTLFVEVKLPNGKRVIEEISLQVKSKDYIVQTGETLTKIAKKFHCNLQTLIDLNNIKNPNNIKVGQRIIIPN